MKDDSLLELRQTYENMLSDMNSCLDLAQVDRVMLADIKAMKGVEPFTDKIDEIQIKTDMEIHTVKRVISVIENILSTIYANTFNKDILNYTDVIKQTSDSALTLAQSHHDEVSKILIYFEFMNLCDDLSLNNEDFKGHKIK